MGFTDETVRFGFDDSRKKEVSETLAIIGLWKKKATIQSIRLSATCFLETRPTFLVIVMHEI